MLLVLFRFVLLLTMQIVFEVRLKMVLSRFVECFVELQSVFLDLVHLLCFVVRTSVLGIHLPGLFASDVLGELERESFCC